MTPIGGGSIGGGGGAANPDQTMVSDDRIRSGINGGLPISLTVALDYMSTHVGGVRLGRDLSDFPDPVLGVRTVAEPYHLTQVIVDPFSQWNLAVAQLSGFTIQGSGLLGGVPGGAAVVIPPGAGQAELDTVMLGNVDPGPTSVGFDASSPVFVLNNATIAPASIAGKVSNVAQASLGHMSIASTVDGVTLDGTIGAAQVQIQAVQLSGGPSPAGYRAIRVLGTAVVGDLLIELDAVGVGGPAFGAGYGLLVDPAVTAPPSGITVRRSSGSPGNYVDPDGLDARDPRLFIDGGTPDRSTTSYGGLVYSDDGDPLIVAYPVGLDPTPLPSDAVIGVVEGRGTMENFVLDTTDPAKAVIRYTGAEGILGEFTWSMTGRNGGGGTNSTTAWIEVNGSEVADSRLGNFLVANGVSSQHAHDGGNGPLAEGDEVTLVFQPSTDNDPLNVEAVSIKIEVV